MLALSIIIPCYNESQSLEKLFDKCHSAIDGRKGIEIIFVNNGSTDNSIQIFETLILNEKYSFAKVINLELNRGYGFGILNGLKASGGEILAWTHADLQTDPSDVIHAYEKNKSLLISKKILIKGRRKGRPLFDNIFTAGMSIVSSIILATYLSDINAQPKIFHRDLMLKMQNAPLDFSLDLYILYLAKKEGYSIISYFVYFGKRTTGQSKGGGSLAGKIRLVKRTFLYILKFRKNKSLH